MSMAVQNTQSTRALSLRQLDAVQTYITNVTSTDARDGYAIQRVIEDGFHATVTLDDGDESFVLAFSDRASRRLDDRYDQLVIQLDIDEVTE